MGWGMPDGGKGHLCEGFQALERQQTHQVSTTVMLRIKGCLGGPFDIVAKDHEADLTLHFFYF